MVVLIAYISRLSNISWEEFDNHWTNHGTLVAERITPVKNGIVKYKQIHVDPQQSAFVKSTGLPVAPYDGVVEWEAERLEDILGIMGSDEYKKYLAPDELKFFQKAEVFVGRGQTEFKSGYTG